MDAMNNALTNVFGPSWKTTVAGYVAGVATYVAGGMDFKHAVLGAALALLGHMAKDGDVTGGTRS